LTFLDFSTKEAKATNVESKVEELEQENEKLKQLDSMNADAVATLSDQVMKLVLEVQEIKKQ
jgi:hypothetical protein